MRSLFTVFLLMMVMSSTAQLSDLISVKKKNGRIIKTFTAGNPIVFETTSGFVASGLIKIIRDDTLFLTSFDIRAFATGFGTNMIDTLNTYTDGYAFSDIQRIKVFRNRGLPQKLGNILMIGSAGYFVLNLVNSDYLKVPFSDSKNIRTLLLSAGGFGLGYVMKTHLRTDNFSTRRHRIHYINLR